MAAWQPSMLGTVKQPHRTGPSDQEAVAARLDRGHQRQHHDQRRGGALGGAGGWVVGRSHWHGAIAKRDSERSL